MKLYLENGYTDIGAYLDTGMPFIYCWGPRGTGKTFTGIKEIVERGLRFFYVRRTETQLKTVGSSELSPFKKINAALGWNIEQRRIAEGVIGFYMEDDLIGYGAALSTFAKIRGFDGSDVKIILYDEFIPEKHEAKRDLGRAFLNLYESIARNRELEGEDPLIALCLANSEDIGNDLFMETGLIDIAQKMQMKRIPYLILRERHILMVNVIDSPISEKKQKTVLYEMLKGHSDFDKMALENEFVDESIAVLKSRNLKEYKPMVGIGSLCIWKHKSDNKYYCTEHFSGSPERFTTAAADREKFQRKYYYLWNAYLDRRIEFESKFCSLLFERMW